MCVVCDILAIWVDRGWGATRSKAAILKPHHRPPACPDDNPKIMRHVRNPLRSSQTNLFEDYPLLRQPILVVRMCMSFDDLIGILAGSSKQMLLVVGCWG